MFQVKFSQVARNLDPEIMDSNYGLAPEQLRVHLKNMYSEITKMKSWNDYFKWLDMSIPTESERNKQLLDAMNLSALNKYHKI